MDRDALKAFAEVCEDGRDQIDSNQFVEALHICNPVHQNLKMILVVQIEVVLNQK